MTYAYIFRQRSDFPAFQTAKSSKSQTTLQDPEVVLYNAVQLSSNLRKGLVQIQCFYRNLIATHMINIIRHKVFIGLCIEKHPGNLMSRTGNRCVFVLHIRKI